VLSTLHTNDAPSAVARLRDIGCEPFLIGSTLLAVVAQRLVRRVCPRCRQTRPATAAELRWLGADGPVEVPAARAGGCAWCAGSGYRGRIGLFEMLWVDDELAQAISLSADARAWAALLPERLTTLRADGLEKVRAGLTTLEEVAANTVAER
jgi:type IV pilus assembly protein PilB